MPVYRYTLNSIDVKRIQRSVAGAITVGAASPVTYVDVTAASGDKADLDEAMALAGYSYDSQDPPTTTTQASIVTNGLKGDTGPALFLLGEDGQDGMPGASGPMGPTGVTGPAGPQGIQGTVGPAVFLLDETIDGQDGLPGAQGIQGIQGATGSAGSTGAIGPAGPAVFLLDETIDGQDGRPGPVGLSGSNGATGAQGPSGPAVFLLGDDGPEGERGTSGAAGPAGAQGLQGPAGPAVFMVADDGQYGEPPSMGGGSSGQSRLTTIVVTASGTITTTSTTAVDVTSLTSTPAQGTYLCFFTGNCWQTNTGVGLYVDLSIWSGGSQVAASAVQASDGPNFQQVFTSMAVTTVNGSQTIVARWFMTAGAGTASMLGTRTLTLVKIG